MYRVVLLTPPVPAAIATIAVEGPDVAEWISKRVALSREMDEPGRVYYGLWSISDRDGRPGQQEQVVVCQRPDGVVEVNTHGGRAVVRAIIDDLVAAGAVESGTLSMDASRTKLAIAAESALIKARTDSAAAILLDQHTGALRRELENIREAVVGHDLSGASGRIRVLLDRSEWGLHLVAPWRIVLAGPPNVGKSSLINALIGTERSIVHDQPGTTRDWVEAETSLGGWPVTITDTAGIRETSESIERQGVVFTDEQIQAADWIVLVVDATAGWQDVHDAVVASCRVRASCMVVAWNKVDHSQSLPAAVPDRKLVTAVGEEVVLPSLTVCSTSCRGEPGVGGLVHFFASELAPDLPSLGAPVPFAASIVDGLRAALSAAESNDQARAELELYQLLS